MLKGIRAFGKAMFAQCVIIKVNEHHHLAVIGGDGQWKNICEEKRQKRKGAQARTMTPERSEVKETAATMR
jgi:hypothetical protein